ncbi:FAD/NAD(P)-binding protein [Nesterenkonia aurantiaca]|uniref:FAD-NAD(P)-binding protein n=1 Tax=Nesterenkonia aurantiaca TaxID=1436010 RepID=A0A4R7G731_9MICC|nr:FAD/NAD(P)-binding protein [Nesterenkonia aurantiaca]TDS87373.1 FAD-NAD(P)-binding protein [Nesterenkonia aurantiaca]
MPRQTEDRSVALIGAGPRGTSFLERLLAALEHGTAAARTPRLRILIIDPAPHGPGRVWNPQQSPLYLMNTPASFPTAAPAGATQVQLPASSVSRSFAQWRHEHEAEETATSVRVDSFEPPVLRGIDHGGTDTDYPTRAAYGQYLSWLHAEVCAGLERQPGITVEHLSAEVTELQRADAGYQLMLSPAGAASPLRDAQIRNAQNGEAQIRDEPLRVDQVVLALGHIPAGLNESGEHFTEVAEQLGLHYQPPAIPTEVDYYSLPAGENVLVRGMGLNFFDLMIQASVGRGGVFHEHADRPAGQRLEYLATGDEPHLVAGSRRGTPYRAKSTALTESPGFAPVGITLHHLNPVAVAEAERRHDLLDFSAHLWPLIQRDVLRTYYRTLVELAPQLFGPEFSSALDELLADAHLGEAVLQTRGQRLLRELAPDVLWFDIRSLGRPFGGLTFESAEQYQEHMSAYLEDDAATSAAGVRSPVKMAIGALHLARMEVKALISQGRVSQSSQISEIEGWFESLVEGLASGPPLQRIEELAALTRAGVVEFLGPEPIFDVDRETGFYTAESPAVAAPAYQGRWLLEAMMPANRVQLSRSPLVAGLLRGGLARPRELVDASGAPRAGKGFDVTTVPHRLIPMDRAEPEEIYVLGLQLSSVQWGTAIAAEAGGDVDSSARSLADADAAARAILIGPGCAATGSPAQD